MSNKTTIILTNIDKDDFLVPNKSYSEYTTKTPSRESRRENLSFVDKIKLNVLNLSHHDSKTGEVQEDYFLKKMKYWSNLPFLNRVIIIMESEEAALNLFNYLTSDESIIHKSKNGSIKVRLQENLLSRSKSHDSVNPSLNNTDDNSLQVLTKFKNYYNSNSDSEPDSPIYSEPQPQKFNPIEDLSKLGIDLSSFNDKDQIIELKETTTKSPNVKRTRSMTKTLFKPDLSIDVPCAGNSKTPQTPDSPIITLDETF